MFTVSGWLSNAVGFAEPMPTPWNTVAFLAVAHHVTTVFYPSGSCGAGKCLTDVLFAPKMKDQARADDEAGQKHVW